MLIPVVLSGGAGTCLWPMSREGHRKSFMKLADGQSLLRKTYRRAAAVASVSEIPTVIGLDNLMIIDTPDALLVAHPDRAQDVKKIVTQLKASGHDGYRLHRTVARPWGPTPCWRKAPASQDQAHRRQARC